MLFPQHRHLPLGKGNLKIHEILHFLLNKNYQGNFILDAMGGSSFLF